jgi:hypothetical protein
MNSIKTLNKLKINLFGENRVLKRLLLNEEEIEQFTKVANKLELPLYQAFADPFFYHLLKNPKLSCIDDLNCEHWEGLINNSKNQIEIWFQNKKIQKCKINDLLEELLLFPLYQTSKISPIDVCKSGIYIEQKEVGLINSFELMLDNFEIDKLLFEISNFQGINHLNGLKYNGQSIPKKRKDTLINYQNGFKID